MVIVSFDHDDLIYQSVHRLKDVIICSNYSDV